MVNANAVSVLQGGAFFGCWFIWPVAARFGRRWSLAAASVVFEIGAILQVINTHSLACFYVGRVISGLGVGAATTMVPIYAAEMSPKEIRGKLGSCFQLFFACGVFVSYWVDYGVSVGIPYCLIARLMFCSRFSQCRQINHPPPANGKSPSAFSSSPALLSALACFSSRSLRVGSLSGVATKKRLSV